MPHVLIIHEVENYSLWKNVFDNAAALCKDDGDQLGSKGPYRNSYNFDWNWANYPDLTAAI